MLTMRFFRCVFVGVVCALAVVAECQSTPVVWTAKWIEQAGMDAKTAQMPVFRHSFVLRERPVKAELYCSALGQGEIHLNGVKVGDAELAPAWTDYRKTVRYEVYDVSAQVRVGENAIGVMVGNGMFNVVKMPGRYTKLENSFGVPKVLLQMVMTYADGRREVIGSDATWKAAPGPIVFSSTYGGEDYDATQEAAGWDGAGFKDAAWAAVRVVDGPGGAMEPEVAPPIRVMQTYLAVKKTEVKPGVWVYDLGQNFAGWPVIEVSGTKGAVVKMVPGELLNEDGTVSQRSSGGPQWFSYVLKGGGTENWHPRFSYYGFRYVQVQWTSGSGEVVSLKGEAVHSSAAVSGEFESSDEMLNRIHKLIVEAMHNNTVSLFTDCPHREKLGWLEETHLVAPGLMFNNDVRGVFAATARNMTDAQKADGMAPTTAPQYTTFGPAYPIYDDSPEWGSASVLATWRAYQFYGDVAELVRAYPTMQRYVAFLEGKAKDGIVDYGLGDWYDIGPGAPGVSKLTTTGVTATLMLYEDAVDMEKIASLLGKKNDAAKYAALAEREKKAFNARFFDAANGFYDKGSQTAQAMPLALGIVPEASRGAVLEHMIADIHAHKDHVTTGEVGFPYMVRVLMESGRSDVLLAMMRRTDAPSYGSQLAAGATALTEAWDANPRASQDHFMLGGGEEWFYRGLAGIDFDMSRKKDERITIRPAMVAGLDWAKGSYDSVLGKVSTEWRREDDDVRVTVNVPANATATVVLRVGSKSLDGARLVGDDFLVGAGVHRFVVRTK
jgi:alpha-L-rhamnosidase